MKKYRRVLISIVILLIGVSFLLFSTGNNKADPFEEQLKLLGVTNYAIGNVMGDGQDYLVGLIQDDVVIYSIGENLIEVYRKDYSHLNPWKIALGDVDGSGKDDISIGAYKESPLHPVMAKRPFIYSFVDGEIQPKWRGSRLSRPFVDYNFYDIDGDEIDELISIEILQDGKNIINSYKWKGFGFEGFIEGKDEYKGKLVLEEDKLIIERMK